MTQWRQSLWRKWKKYGGEGRRAAYRAVDKRVKREARAAKARSFNEFVANLEGMPVHSAVSTMSKLIKARRQRKLLQKPASQRIDPVQFTKFVATQHPRPQGERRLQRRRFQVDEQWRADIEWAVRCAPRGKATGTDELFGEALQAPGEELMAEWLLAVWICCGRHAIMPSAWQKSILCPILKKEPASAPQNWRAIALLSHGRN